MTARNLYLYQRRLQKSRFLLRREPRGRSEQSQYSSLYSAPHMIFPAGRIDCCLTRDNACGRPGFSRPFRYVRRNSAPLCTVHLSWQVPEWHHVLIKEPYTRLGTPWGLASMPVKHASIVAEEGSSVLGEYLAKPVSRSPVVTPVTCGRKQGLSGMYMCNNPFCTDQGVQASIVQTFSSRIA